MKKLLPVVFLFMSVLAYSQDKDCKFEKAKDIRTGKPLQIITASTRLGKLIMGKTGDSIYAIYSMKLLFALAADTRNMVRLRIDSVLFQFTDYTHINMTAAGVGTAPNVLNLKPQFQDVNFSVIFEPSAIPLFKEKKLQYIKIFGEKDAETGDGLSDKQAEKLSKAFNCLQLLQAN